MNQKQYKDNNKAVNGNASAKTFINFNKENNECYTTPLEADKLANYLINKKIININSKIWLPFNDHESAIFNSLKKYGFKNLIATDTDFYETNIDYDIIISNPPFSKRTNLMNRLMELDKPFILLQPVMLFNNSSCIRMITSKSSKFGYLCPTNRMNFILNGEIRKTGTSFYSFWFCYKTKIKGFKELPNLKENKND